MRSQQISDLNTNNPSIVAKKFLFSDLDSTFTRNPFTGDLYLKKDIEAVKKAIVNIVLTGNFERPFQPRFGANIREYLFELLDENVIDTIQTVITNAIETYEPRAKVRDIRINEDTQDSNKISVSIEFAMVSTGKIADVTTVLERVR